MAERIIIGILTNPTILWPGALAGASLALPILWSVKERMHDPPK